MARLDVGSFGVPANFVTNYYTPTTQTYDYPGMRSYLRRELPPDRWNLTDEQLDQLISGAGLEGPLSMYDLQAGQGGSYGTSDRRAKAVGDVSASELEETAPDEPEVAPIVEVDEPSPPPPADDLSGLFEEEGVTGTVQQDRSKAYYNPDVGGIRGTFYGSYGTQIDPATGQILPGTEPYMVPLFDPGQVYASRTSPAGKALGSYQDLFPIYLYGSAPGNTLVELDRYGLGLDFVRQNPTLLQQWWVDVFKPVYQRFAGNIGDYTRAGEGEYSPWRAANIIRYMANPLDLLFGAGGAGPVGEAAWTAGRNLLGMDPSQLQLDLPLVPDSLLGQLFGERGLTIDPGTSQAVLNALGNIDIPVEAFAPENREATIQYLQDFFGPDSVPLGPEAFTPAHIEATRLSLLDRLGDIVVPGEQFAPGEGVVESLLEKLGVIEVGTGQFKPAPGALAALKAHFPNIEISADSFSPANAAETRQLLAAEIGRILVDPEQFAPGEGVIDKLLTDLGIVEVAPGQFVPGEGALEALQAAFPSVEISPASFTPENIAATKGLLRDAIGAIFVSPEQFKLGEGYYATTGPYNVEDKLLEDLGIIRVGPDQFDISDPAAVVEALRDLIPSIVIGPEAFSPANIAGTVERLKGLIPDVTIDPSQFSPTDIDATVEKLISDLGEIQVGPEQFALGTDLSQAGERTVEQKLLDDLGVVEVSPGQFKIEDKPQAIRGLLRDLGFIQVGPDRFELAPGAQGLTAEQKLLQDLGIIKVGPEGFEPTDTAAIKLELLNDIGMITVGVGQEAGFDAYWEAIDAGVPPEEAQRIFEEGTPGFILDPAAAGILREELVSAINPITAMDIERDPQGIADVIREDIVSKIDAINRGDIGLTDEDIATLLDPLRTEIGALPGEFTEKAGDPISALIATLMAPEGKIGGMPEQFRTDVEAPISEMIENLRTSLVEDIGGFEVPEDFLQTGTEKAGSLLDLLYGTGIGDDRAGRGIEGFQIPATIGQLSTRLGSFGDEWSPGEGILGKVGALQEALTAIDLDALTAPPGLGDLVSDVGQLGIDLPGATEGLGLFQEALGAFSAEDQAIMGMLLNMIGPEGLASLGTEQLTDLITRFKEMQGTALTDALGDYWAEPRTYEPWLEALQKGVLGTFGPLPEMEWEGLLPSIKEAIGEKWYEHEPTFKRAVGNIDEIRRILKEGEAGTGTGTGTGAGTGEDGMPAESTTTGWLKTLQDALAPKIAGPEGTGLPPLTADYLATEPTTFSLLEDLGAQQATQGDELLEQLQRYGVMTSGATAKAIPELQSLQRRERLGVLGDAATRIGQQRETALQQALDLGRTTTTRELGLGELTGLTGGEQTLGGRQADLDIISAVIAALDPELQIKGNKEELAELLLELLANVPGGEDADWISRFKTMVMGD
jgi:hypothetical protein